ncbi:hypothetical protein RR42_s3020 [Cupriavidus basilensis]|uniref:Uncharacterized protein n=1 Tax=Cupriavidus basilensis TaxID=68895 RepID=A0A0C4YVP1_9BURK|nr:hypothetical protein RR42_s3020 [Cupriavidus basilensis]
MRGLNGRHCVSPQLENMAGVCRWPSARGSTTLRTMAIRQTHDQQPPCRKP